MGTPGRALDKAAASVKMYSLKIDPWNSIMNNVKKINEIEDATRLSNDILFEGELSKYNKDSKVQYLSRWCQLSHTQFMYFKDEISSFSIIRRPLIKIPLESIKKVKALPFKSSFLFHFVIRKDTSLIFNKVNNKNALMCGIRNNLSRTYERKTARNAMFKNTDNRAIKVLTIDIIRKNFNNFAVNKNTNCIRKDSNNENESIISDNTSVIEINSELSSFKSDELVTNEVNDFKKESLCSIGTNENKVEKKKNSKNKNSIQNYKTISSNNKEVVKKKLYKANFDQDYNKVDYEDFEKKNLYKIRQEFKECSSTIKIIPKTSRHTTSVANCLNNITQNGDLIFASNSEEKCLKWICFINWVISKQFTHQ